VLGAHGLFILLAVVIIRSFSPASARSFLTDPDGPRKLADRFPIVLLMALTGPHGRECSTRSTSTRVPGARTRSQGTL